MSSCPGCLPQGRELAALYDTKRKQAIDLSKKEGFEVAIYRTVEGYDIMKADIAQSNNYPIKEIVSYSV